MSQQPKSKSASSAARLTKDDDIGQVIYADRVLNAGFGPGVSRLTLGIEASIGNYSPTVTLILPTPALLEAMTAVLNAINGNSELKAELIKGLDAFKEQLTAIK